MTTKARAELRAIAIKMQELSERKNALEKFLSVYSEFSQGFPGEGGFTLSPASPPEAVTAKARIIASSFALLADGRYLHTRELLDELHKLGIEVGGKDQIQTLSALLSQDQSKRFVPNRKSGWSLKKASAEAVPLAPIAEAPSPEPTGDGFDD